MRSQTPADLAGRCVRCYLRTAVCLCAELPRIVTRTRFVILQHALELYKTSSSGRLAALALPRARCVGYGGRPGTPLALAPGALSTAPGTWLLFPGATEVPPPEAVAEVIVPDASWPQARRMVQRIPELAKLPRLALLQPARVIDRLRQPRRAGERATIEAIADVLAALEGETLAEPLHHLYARFVQATRQTSNRRQPQVG